MTPNFNMLKILSWSFGKKEKKTGGYWGKGGRGGGGLSLEVRA